MKIRSPLHKNSTLWVSQSYKPTHQALDFGLPTAKAHTKLYAVEDGKLTREAPTGAPHVSKLGFTLRGKSGALYLYQHAQPCVGSGDQVKRGQHIGYIDTAQNQRRLGHNMMNGNEHLHFEIHPTGKWDVRGQPLCYFDRDEVKYNRQPACTSTPLDYKSVPDKQLPDGKTSFKLVAEGNDLYMRNVKGKNFSNDIIVTRPGMIWVYDYADNSDKKIVSGMNENTVYTVGIGSYIQAYHNKPIDYKKKYEEEQLANEEMQEKLEACIGEKEQYRKTNQGLMKKNESLTTKNRQLAIDLQKCQNEDHNFNLFRWIYEKLFGKSSD